MEIFGFTMVELVGYVASLGVLSSFLLKDIRKLRIVNTVGCFLFVAYGFMLEISWPVIITNVSIIIINAYYLLKKGVIKNLE